MSNFPLLGHCFEYGCDIVGFVALKTVPLIPEVLLRKKWRKKTKVELANSCLAGK